MPARRRNMPTISDPGLSRQWRGDVEIKFKHRHNGQEFGPFRLAYRVETKNIIRSGPYDLICSTGLRDRCGNPIFEYDVILHAEMYFSVHTGPGGWAIERDGETELLTQYWCDTCQVVGFNNFVLMP